MTDIHVRFLGSEGRAPEQMGVLVNESIMLEAPPTALYHLQRLGRDVAGLRVIFVSSLEGDRTFGLTFILAERAARGVEQPLWIVGPRGIAGHTLAQLRVAYPDDYLGIVARAAVKWEEVGVAYSRNRTVAYDAVPLPGAAAYGYRFIAGGRVVSYCPLARKGHRAEQPAPGRLGDAADVFIRPAGA